MHLLSSVLLDALLFFFLCSCLRKAKAEEQLQETQGKIDVLLKELSSLDTSREKSLGETVPDANVPVGSLNSHSDTLKVRTELFTSIMCVYLNLVFSIHSFMFVLTFTG